MALRHTLAFLLSSLIATVAFGQGVGTPTAASDEDVGPWTVNAGAGTTSATTTGSSGPKRESGKAAGQYSCYNVNQKAAREHCLRAMLPRRRNGDRQ